MSAILYGLGCIAAAGLVIGLVAWAFIRLSDGGEGPE